MDTLTQPLRDDHHRLLHGLKAMQRTADLIDELALATLRSRLEQIEAFLSDQLLPHARAEAAAVYPRIARLIGRADAIRGIAADDVEIERLARKLSALRERLVYSYFGASERHALRRTLYELAMAIRLHLDKEDEVYLPMLDQGMSAADAIEMLDQLGQAEKQASVHVA